MTDVLRHQPPAPPISDGLPDGADDGILDIVAAQLGVVRTSITSTTLFEEMGADIYDMAEIVVTLEEAFGVEIADEEVDRLVTVGDLIERVKAHADKRASAKPGHSPTLRLRR